MSEEENQEENTTTPTTRRVTAKVGYFDGEVKEANVQEGQSVRTLIENARLDFADGQKITDRDGEELEPTTVVEGFEEDGTTPKFYYIVGNYKQG